jgi:oligopeptide/dipeptide ABC transporter ATP-binding protein
MLGCRRMMMETLLEVKDIKKYFPVHKGFLFSRTIAHVKAVDDISFTVKKGDTFCLVGESGCGKTTTMKLILLLEELTSGSIFYEEKDISQFDRKGQKLYRAAVQAMFQDPYGSLNPRKKVGEIINEPIIVNLEMPKDMVDERVAEILHNVGLDSKSAELYPHEFSGGQRQRVALARALAINPNLVILDEPVSALDVSVRAQLMNLLMEIQEKMGVTYIVIAHDLATVRHLSNRMAVMYLGKIVEYGNSEEIFKRRLHPYTQALFSAALPSHPDDRGDEIMMPGEVPSPINPPSGCHFHPRCLHCKDDCRELEPQLESAGSDHHVACHFWEKLS